MITNHIKQVLGLETLPEKQDPRWEMFDDGGVEVGVGELLYGFVRANKPLRILETGTYSGISSIYMGLALKKNGEGTLTTIEYEQIHATRAKKRFIKLGLQDIVKITLQSSLDFQPQGEYDLLFLDTELNIRFKELVKFYPHLKEGGFVFIHDMPRNLCQGNINPDHPEFKHWPVGEIPDQVKQWVKEDKLRPIYFNTARGMMGFYKKHKEDYL